MLVSKGLRMQTKAVGQARNKADGHVAMSSHLRVDSRSTAASSSPEGSETDKVRVEQGLRIDRKMTKLTQKAFSPIQKQRLAKKKRFPDSQTSQPVVGTKARIAQRPNEENTFSGNAPAAPQEPRTPNFMNEEYLPLPTVTHTPHGHEYIVTPGQHLIDMNEFLTSCDRRGLHCGIAQVRGNASFNQPMYDHWRQLESQIDTRVHMLSFPGPTPMETFRRMAVQCVFNYAVSAGLSEKTVHMALLNINRLLWSHVASAKMLTDDLFACIVMASLRNSIKLDECFHQTESFRYHPMYLWEASQFCSDMANINRSVKKLNEIEGDCMRVLEHPLNPPVAPDFLERFLVVGGYPPKYQEHYKELGSFLLGVALFVHGDNNPLRGVPGSKLAAAALVLAIKVINTDKEFESFEYWPMRLEYYSGYTIDELKPYIRGISSLLRNKPTHAKVLSEFYPKWGQFDWN